MAAHESNVQASIIRGLKDAGAWYTKVHQSGYGRQGIPDLLVCYRGVFFGIEVKNEDGRPTGPQVAELNAIRDAGGVGIIARSWAEVAALLDEMDCAIDEGHGPSGIVDHLPDLPKIRRVEL